MTCCGQQSSFRHEKGSGIAREGREKGRKRRAVESQKRGSEKRRKIKAVSGITRKGSEKEALRGRRRTQAGKFETPNSLKNPAL
jgi:hypothetical protein